MKWYEKQKMIFTEKEKMREGLNEESQTMSEETGNAEGDQNLSKIAINVVEDANALDKRSAELTVNGAGCVIEGNIQTAGDMIFQGNEIRGNLETHGNLEFFATIVGDIVCHGNLSVKRAAVQGTIQCGEAQIEDGSIEGDISGSGKLTIHKDSTINGNINTESVETSGRIKGQITAAKSVHLASSAIMLGDVRSEDIEIEQGAQMRGNITMKQDNQEGAGCV